VWGAGLYDPQVICQSIRHEMIEGSKDAHDVRPTKGKHTQKRLVIRHPDVSNRQLITRDRYTASSKI
jgi:hypothetical protein